MQAVLASPGSEPSVQARGSDTATQDQAEYPQYKAKGLKRAYVTLLYSDFLAGTRALGRSLLDTGTTADLVVLVTPDVPQASRRILELDGWK